MRKLNIKPGDLRYSNPHSDFEELFSPRKEGVHSSPRQLPFPHQETDRTWTSLLGRVSLVLRWSCPYRLSFWELSVPLLLLSSLFFPFFHFPPSLHFLLTVSYLWLSISPWPPPCLKILGQGRYLFSIHSQLATGPHANLPSSSGQKSRSSALQAEAARENSEHHGGGHGHPQRRPEPQQHSGRPATLSPGTFGSTLGVNAQTEGVGTALPLASGATDCQDSTAVSPPNTPRGSEAGFCSVDAILRLHKWCPLFCPNHSSSDQIWRNVGTCHSLRGEPLPTSF